jgi:hypothetical protein
MPNNQLGVHAQQSLGQAAPMSAKNLPLILASALEVDVKFIHSLHAFLKTTTRMTPAKAMGDGAGAFLQRFAATTREPREAFGGGGQ